MSTLRKSTSIQVQRDSAEDEENVANSGGKDVQRGPTKTGKDTGASRILSKPFTARQLHTAAAQAHSKTNPDDGNAENARAGGARAGRGDGKKRGRASQRQVDDSGNFSISEANGSKRARLAELSDSDESDSAGTSSVPRVRSESVRGVRPTRIEARPGASRN